MSKAVVGEVERLVGKRVIRNALACAESRYRTEIDGDLLAGRQGVAYTCFDVGPFDLVDVIIDRELGAEWSVDP